MKKVIFFLFFFGLFGHLTFGEGRLLLSATGQPLVILDISYYDDGIMVDDQVRSFPDSLIYKALALPGDTVKCTTKILFMGMDGPLFRVHDKYSGMMFDGRKIHFIDGYYSQEYTKIPTPMFGILIAIVLMLLSMLFSKRPCGLFVILSFCFLFGVWFFWLINLLPLANGSWIIFTSTMTLVAAVLVASYVDSKKKFWFKIFLLTIISYFIAIYMY